MTRSTVPRWTSQNKCVARFWSPGRAEPTGSEEAQESLPGARVGAAAGQAKTNMHTEGCKCRHSSDVISTLKSHSVGDLSSKGIQEGVHSEVAQFEGTRGPPGPERIHLS